MEFFNFLKKKQSAASSDKITASRIRGRWYGMMIVLGQELGMEMKFENKAQEVIAMLKLSNLVPEEMKIVNKLIALQKTLESDDEMTDDDRQAQYMLGAVEAKQVFLEDKKWERLLLLEAWKTDKSRILPP